MVGAPWFNGGKGGGYRMQPRYLGVTDCRGITVWVYREKHLCQIDTYNVVSLTQSDKNFTGTTCIIDESFQRAHLNS